MGEHKQNEVKFEDFAKKRFENPGNRGTYIRFKMSAAPPSAGDKPQQREQQQNQPEKRKKESILDLSKYLEKGVRIKFAGGRECSGILKGYDPLLNIVVDNTVEYLRDPDDPYKLTEDTRHLGLVVCRGTAVVLVCPVDG